MQLGSIFGRLVLDRWYKTTLGGKFERDRLFDKVLFTQYVSINENMIVQDMKITFIRPVLRCPAFIRVLTGNCGSDFIRMLIETSGHLSFSIEWYQ
ncbi:hypothetical protein CEXT_270301 [Caerostris extrusa]|uniref:Uncharacterized protein n=1 Tax=Caerostris extrusa TaxID=172846 RepID=A0AAV4TK87_CAEEX|nr:hypothetical protein CEXT_270301 [Caerostris extrusa]